MGYMYTEYENQTISICFIKFVGKRLSIKGKGALEGIAYW